MKRVGITFLIIWVLFLLQSTVFKFLQIASTSPNLLLILTVSIGYLRGKKAGMFTGFTCGMLLDLFYGTVFGFYALIYLLIGYACGLTYNIFFEDDLKVPMALVCVSDFAYGVIVYLTRFFMRGRVYFPGYLKNVIFPEMIYTMIMTVVLYWIIYAINKKLAAREKGSAKNLWLRG